MPSRVDIPSRSPLPPPHACRRRAVATLVALALAVQPIVPAMSGIAPAAAQALPTFGMEALPDFSTRGLTGGTLGTSGASPVPALPDLGDESQALLTPVQEKKLGESVVRQIRAQGGYLDDPEVNDYLQALGQRLVAAVPDARIDFVFFAVPDAGINAFALPGGFIGVNTGLILLAQNESELASVLAHEISHVTQHHMTRMLSAQKGQAWLQLAALALAIAMARGGNTNNAQGASAALASAQALGIQSQINFTREHEYEADRIGFQRLAAAGFDVNAAATFMEKLQRATRFADNPNTPSYLRTHPITSERIAEAQARAQGKPYRQVTDSLDFHLVRALLRSYAGTSKDAVTGFDYAIAERKYNNEIAAHYGLVASLLRAADYKRAKVELAKLEKMAPPDPMIDAMAAHVYLEAGDVDMAVKRFETALARYPNKMQLIYDYPDALVAANRTKDAVAFIERELARYPGDGRLHRTAAKAYATLGNRMQQHRHQAEYYAWQGDLKGAVTQLELAVKANDGDFYQASVVETRLRALRQELEDQPKNNSRNG
jgi:predicted Zn-dependent protease